MAKYKESALVHFTALLSKYPQNESKGKNDNDITLTTAFDKEVAGAITPEIIKNIEEKCAEEHYCSTCVIISWQRYEVPDLEDRYNLKLKHEKEISITQENKKW